MTSPTPALPVLPHQRRSLRPDSAFAAKILGSFNTWTFKREQPSDTRLIAERIADAVRGLKPVPFVLYWGKGPRNDIAQPDLTCLQFLRSLSERIEAVHAPGAEFGLILTDTHAELNGHPRADYDRYFADIEKSAKTGPFKCHRLSDIVTGLLRAEDAIAAPAASLEEACLARLAPSAERWFRGNGSARDGAETYLRANLVERRAVERAFPDAIFATFNGSEFDFLFPASLPKFYMYSLRKGCSVKPWFMDASGQAVARAPSSDTDKHSTFFAN